MYHMGHFFGSYFPRLPALANRLSVSRTHVSVQDLPYNTFCSYSEKKFMIHMYSIHWVRTFNQKDRPHVHPNMGKVTIQASLCVTTNLAKLD